MRRVLASCWPWAWVFAAVLICGESYCAQAPRVIYRRARPPKADASAGAGIFFDDVFAQGVTGQRPTNLRPAVAPASDTAPQEEPSTTKPGKKSSKKLRRNKRPRGDTGPADSSVTARPDRKSQTT